MKVQIERQKLRVRIDEDELAQLLEGHSLYSITQFAGAFSIEFAIEAVERDAAAILGNAAAWHIALPVNDLRHHAAKLPSRDGLNYRLRGPAEADVVLLLFDVDARDSARRRKSPS